jgi:hypothetical protein
MGAVPVNLYEVYVTVLGTEQCIPLEAPSATSAAMRTFLQVKDDWPEVIEFQQRPDGEVVVKITAANRALDLRVVRR